MRYLAAIYISLLVLSPLSVFSQQEEITIKVGERVPLRVNPHTSGEDGCLYCHVKVKVKSKVKGKEETVELLKLSKSKDKLCASCHNEGPDHTVDPFPYSLSGLKEQMKKRGILIAKAEINCLTCHDQHAASGRSFQLITSVDNFYTESKSIDPHWRKGYCFGCHSKNAKKYPSSFKRKGNIEEVCGNCHDAISGDMLIHATGMIPSRQIKSRMPKSFKLSSDGKIGCLTCHELKYQCLEKEYKRKSEDPMFFRDGPYKSRTDLCYKCHKKKSYGRLNPHDQINDEGELMKDICLYCHEELPDPRVDKGIGKVNFVVDDLKELCQRCHRDRPHPGGSFIDFDHLVTPSPKIKFFMRHAEEKSNVVLPLEPDTGKIFCATCHNPHERGVLRGRSGKGADEPQRLRLQSGFEICGACHPDKTGM